MVLFVKPWFPMDSLLEVLSDHYGANTVAQSLLVLAAFHPDFRPHDRRGAGAAYGLMHTLYPRAAPITPIPSLLAEPSQPDYVKIGFVEAAAYLSDDYSEIDDALGVLFCHTLVHVSPFVQDPSDLLRRPPSRSRPEWYESALELLKRTVHVLALRQNGPAVLESYLVDEHNRVLVDGIRAWAEKPDTLHYWGPLE
jgi:hypothetical protein